MSEASLHTGSETALWQQFQRRAVRLRDNPALIRDREFMREFARCEQAWKDAFLADAA